jgi:ABC-2 type transport system ATP-binding protein
MVALLRDLRAEGRTVFLSSHFLAEVETLCNRVAVLKSGVLIAEGAPADITRNGEGWVSVTARRIEREQAARVAGEFGGSVEAEDAAGPGDALRLVVPERWVYPVLGNLEAARATLVSVTPVRESLEAAFFRLVAGDEVPLGKAA